MRPRATWGFCPMPFIKGNGMRPKPPLPIIPGIGRGAGIPCIGIGCGTPGTPAIGPLGLCCMPILPRWRNLIKPGGMRFRIPKSVGFGGVGAISFGNRGGAIAVWPAICGCLIIGINHLSLAIESNMASQF